MPIHYKCLILLTLLATAAPSAAQDEEIEQWASIPIGESSGTNIQFASPGDILGPPEGNCEFLAIFSRAVFEAGVTEGSVPDSVLPYVDDSWRTQHPDSGEEWIELRYLTPVHATAVEVYETLNPGALTRILARDFDGQWHEVWTGPSPAVACPAVVLAEFDRLPFPTNTLRLELNTALVEGYNQIDAVKLVGTPLEGFKPAFAALPAKAVEPRFTGFDPNVFADFDNDGWPDGIGRDLGGARESADFILHNEGHGVLLYRGPTLPQPDPFQFITNGGPVTGDYDNDGDLDIFYAVGLVSDGLPVDNLLLRNDRGVFVDVTAQAGLSDGGISNTVIWLDYDRDGFLDLYVGNWTFIPNSPARQNALYRNNGDGTFTDATADAGLDIDWHTGEDSPWVGGTGWGFFSADFNDDSWVDLYVVVGDSPNRLFYNDGGRFREAASPDIRLNTGFGATAGDFDNDLDLDLFQASPFAQESNERGERLPQRSTLFMNLGDEQFVDVTEGVGLQLLIANSTFFGRFFDFDHDADVDLFFGGPPVFFENTGNGTFVERAVDGQNVNILADLDGDGSIDVINNNQHLRNQSADSRDDAHYLSIDLVGTESNRDGIGAVLIATTGDVRQRRDLMAGDGWHQDEPIVHFGLGAATTVDQLKIRWPSGQVDFIDNIPADQRIRVIEGRGEWLPAPRTVWETPPPTELAFGENARFRAVVRPALFEPTATITEITADLSGLGGPEEVPLEDLGNGTYAFDADFAVGGDAVMRDVEVFILQETSLGEHWINLSRQITVKDDPFTAVLEAYDSTTPESFSLNQNYPNPFNSGTVIPFALPSGDEVELAVFNMAGQKVATLVKGYREAGQYKITWDGRDDAGHSLATGLYLYRLHNASAQSTQKLLLLR